MEKNQIVKQSLCQVLIPAAGYGRRMGSPPAKELLSHPDFPDKNFMQIAIQRCLEVNLKPLVISRVDKTELNEYLFQHRIPFTLIENSEDWPETLLKSFNHWTLHSIVLLPDTTFKPEGILKNLADDLFSQSLSLSLFKIQDSSLWGGVGFDQNKIEISEKKIGYQYAWGHLAFHRNVGKELLERLHQKKNFQFNDQFSVHHLEHFEDLTRPKLSISNSI
jgi:hypothetical protein